MTNEIENKNVDEKDSQTSAKSESTLNALELLSSAGAGASALAEAAANSLNAKNFGKEVLGQLQITDKHSSSQIEQLENLLGGKERHGMKEIPLSRTEQLILGNMQDAIKSGSLDKVQDMLSTLAENPASVNRVLRELNARMSKENPLNSASWEQGRDSNGNDFVRLRLNHMDSFSKSSGGTEITIGSDGRNSASYRSRYDSPSTAVEPSKAMHLFGEKTYDYRLHEYNNYKK